MILLTYKRTPRPTSYSAVADDGAEIPARQQGQSQFAIGDNYLATIHRLLRCPSDSKTDNWRTIKARAASFPNY